MINKFLKNPFGYAIIWLILTILYGILAWPQLDKYSLLRTTTLLWTFRGIALLGFLIPFFAAFLYTVLFYKKRMDFTFKNKSVAIFWLISVAAYFIVTAFVNPDTAHIFIARLASFLFLLPPGSSRLPFSIGYVIFYPLDYGLITLGNDIALRLLSRTNRMG